jgi:S-adenosylmethionine:diacylglycerol 3-amino-3-carboxypropyl transferase
MGGDDQELARYLGLAHYRAQRQNVDRVAAEIGVSPSTLRALIDGRRAPGRKSRGKLARWFARTSRLPYLSEFPHAPDRSTSVRVLAIDVLLEDFHRRAQAPARRKILGLLLDEYERNGVPTPDYLRSLVSIAQAELE